jgi:class 3 adenylate cyclase
MARTRRFLREVTRRHVVPVTIGYSVAAWLIVQVASIVLPAFSAPIWGLRAVIVLAVLGFPMALVVAWLFDITPKGLVRTSDVDGVLPDLATQALPAPNPIVAERRQITVLHVHLKWAGLRGGTPDAEDLRGATSTFRGQVEKIAERYRAGIVRLNSHRMVLYFGFPEASENDARHAADAALAIVEGARTFTLVGAAVESIRVVARIGIDTDVAVVEAADGHRPEVVGNLTERAEWIQTLAPDEAIFLSPATQRLLAGYYEIRHVDNLQHDGAGAPLSIYQLVGEASQSRLEARGIFAQLIGRETELALLRQRWARMLEGGGEIVVVSGESGLGKSRLIHEFERVVAEDAPAVIQRLVCYADYRNSALYPVRRFFQKQLEDGLSSSDGETALVDSLERRLTAAGCDPTIAVPLMLEFLGRGQTPRYPEPQLSSTLRKTRTLEVLLALLLAPASQVPLLLLIDDFHWADPTFRELVQMIVSQGPGTRVLAILATRPEGIPEWITRAHISQISVGPLTTSETKALVSAIGESIGLPDGVVAKLAHNAQGNPLFAEELTRGVVERGDLKQLDSDSADIDDFEIPLTLQESLSAQLDRLPIGARVVARLAATIGREFSYEIIRAFAAGLDVSDFDASLVELVSAEIVYPPLFLFLRVDKYIGC